MPSKLHLRTEKLNEQLTEDILDLKCRSLRENLLFYGVTKAPNGESGNCEDLYQKGLWISKRPCPIVAKFTMIS